LSLDCDTGKTTILYQLKLGHEVVTIPTIGHVAETIEFGNLNLTVYDLGGWINQPFWNYYLPGVAVSLLLNTSSWRM
jgi:ADP-ribosylation factor protein 1